MFLPSRNEKGRILTTLCEDIYRYKSYPTDADCALVCNVLITTFPCLKEKGGPLGYEAWKNSVKFKMGNLRNKLGRAGVVETSTNVGRKSKYLTSGTPPAKDIKKARCSEANYLPCLPNNQTGASLEENVESLKIECSKIDKDMRMISNIMEKTFAQRRQEIVGNNPRPLITEVMLRWPALFTEAQVIFYCNMLKNELFLYHTLY